MVRPTRLIQCASAARQLDQGPHRRISIRASGKNLYRTNRPDISMDGPDLCGFSLFSCSSVACRHLSGLFDPDGIRDTAPKHLTLFSSDMSVGLCHASVGQPICHQTSFTLADLIPLVCCTIRLRDGSKSQSRIVSISMHHDRPGDARKLVGVGHRCNIGGPACQ